LCFSPDLKPVIERRFPQNKILDEELLLGYDNKLRYSFLRRQELYAHLLKAILRHSRKLIVSEIE
jgi:spore photoproduct lyase